MLKVNNTGVKKVLFNNTIVHKVTVNGTTVFDDECYVDWSIDYWSAGSGRGQVWGANLTVSATSRKDSYSGGNSASITVTTHEQSGSSTITPVTEYYTSPCDNIAIAGGGSSAGPYGDQDVTVSINGTQVDFYNFLDYDPPHQETRSGRVYFYDN